MKKNYGKDFESHFAKDWSRTFPGQFLMRLKDDVSGYYGTSRNACDYLAHVDTTMFMIETKSHYGNTFPFSDLRQYDELKDYRGLKNVELGVVIWYIDHDRILYFPFETVVKMKEVDNLKSINIKKLEGYDYIEIPSTKLRVFLESDYSVVRKLVQ